MKNIIKYWPILKYDLLELFKLILFLIIVSAALAGFGWLITVLGIEIFFQYAAVAFVVFLFVLAIVMYFKDLPNRLRDKEFRESFDRNYYAREQAEREERERQRNAEH